MKKRVWVLDRSFPKQGPPLQMDVAYHYRKGCLLERIYGRQIREIGREVVLKGSKGEGNSRIMEGNKEIAGDNPLLVLQMDNRRRIKF